ncbi:unnamed protein product [Caenorhabditis nigoni]
MPCKLPESAYSNPETIQKFVLYDVLQGISPNVGFQRLCKTLRQNLDYPKYEYLYYQFYNGNPELDMPKSFSKSFSDLPMELLDGIVGNLNLKQRFRVRRVCQNLRDVIDQHKSRLKIFKVSFDCEKRWNILKVDDLDQKFLKKSYKKTLKLLGNFLKTSSHVESFELKLDNSEGSKSVLNMLRDVSMTSLNVENAKISAINTDEALEILGFFEPGELKKIELQSERGNGNVRKLVEMEQFKLAESVDIRKFGVFDSELLEKFLHLKRFVVKVNSISKENALRLKNAILEDSGPQILSVSLREQYDLVEILDHLEIDEESGDEGFNYTYFTQKFQIPLKKFLL